MAARMMELAFLQHLAPRFNLPVPEFLTVDATGAQIRDALSRWGGKALVKADAMGGHRGKCGAVRTVSDHVEAQRELKRVQGKEVEGHLPRTAYLVQYVPADIEVYSAITYDSRSLGPAMTISLSGGVDVDTVEEERKITCPIDVYNGFAAYQANEILDDLKCPQRYISPLAQCLVRFWDMFISTGMRMCEVNPWRISAGPKVYACDFKALFDGANFKFGNLGFAFPEYPAHASAFEEEMNAWDASSHRGQAHVSDLGGRLILPILFGGGASTIITETLIQNGGDPIFLSDFGGNPPYERMYGTAKICFAHHLAGARLLLILGGKANNTLIDVTFKAIADALRAYADEHGPLDIPVVIGRGGPRLAQGLLTMKDTLESLGLPYVIFGPDTPVTLVAEYAAKLAGVLSGKEARK